jgi:hypothetical protein
MTSSVSLPGSSSDGLDEATRHLRGLAVLLMRLFEAFAAHHADAVPGANGPGGYEPEFWAGLHDVTADLVRTAEDVQRLATRSPVTAPQALATLSNGHEDDADSASALCLASDLARDALNVDLGTIIEDHQDDWSALVHAVRAEKFHGDTAVVDSVEPLELYSKVITTLPVELRRDFRRLTEWRTAGEIAERQAAFELGRQIERHARASRR